MPITYTISAAERRVRAIATGIIRADDLDGLVESLLKDPGLAPGLRGLYDAGNGEPDITVLQLAAIAPKVRQLLNRGLGRIAIVAQSPPNYRVARTFTVLARAVGIDVDVFKELREAEAWLAQDNDVSKTHDSSLC
jgi:hypothetical protein